MTADQALDPATTQQQCTSATGTLGTTDEVLDAATRMLLRSGTPITLAELADDVGVDAASVEATVVQHESRGRILRQDGAIVAAAGVSLVPSDYELHIGGRTLWAWCATTSLGVVGALGIGGDIVSHDPVTGAELRTRFEGPRPVATPYAVFWPSEQFRDSCQSAAGEYCDTLNLFESEETARSWAATSGVPGDVLSVDEAVSRTLRRWVGSLDVEGKGASLVAALSAGARADSGASGAATT